jgi:hypothetical protein
LRNFHPGGGSLIKMTNPQNSARRVYRFLGFLAVAHSAAVFGLSYLYLPRVWLAFATLLFLWVLILALHRGRSVFGFLIPVAIAAGLFVPCAYEYKMMFLIEYHPLRVEFALSNMLHSPPHRMTLSSVDPALGDSETPHDPNLGEAEITDPVEQKALLSALIEGIKNNDGHGFLCFNPRHSLHIEDGAKSVDLLICFECEKILTDGYTISVSRAPEPVFDAALKRHGLPKSQH